MKNRIFFSWTGEDEDLVKDVSRKVKEEFGKGSFVWSVKDCVGDFKTWSTDQARKCAVVLLFATPDLLKKTKTDSLAYEEIAAAYEAFEKEEKGSAAYRILPVFCSEDDRKKGFKFTISDGSEITIPSEDRRASEYMSKACRASACIWGKDDLIENLRPLLRREEHRAYVRGEAEALEERQTAVNYAFREQDVKINFVSRKLLDQQGKDYTWDPVSEDRPLAVVGEAGFGKSTFGRQLFIEKQNVFLEKEILPFLITASDYKGDLKKTLAEKYGGDLTWLSDKNPMCNGLYLIIDGYDEFSDGRKLRKQIADLRKELNKMSFGQLYLSRFDPLRDHHKVLTLAPVDQKELIGNYLDDPTGFEEKLEKVDEKLKANPFILTLLINLYKRFNEIPVTLWKVYKKTVDAMLDRQKSEKANSIDAEAVKAVKKKCGEIAYKIAFENEPAGEAFEEEEMGSSIPFLRDGAAFLHESFRDFFAVQYLFLPEKQEKEMDKKLEKEKKLLDRYGEESADNMLRFYLSRCFAEEEKGPAVLNDILNKKPQDYTLLLEAALETKDDRHLELQSRIVENMLLRAADEKDENFPPYGPLFYYGPKYGLYAVAIKALDGIRRDHPDKLFPAMALTRDLCFMYGMYPTAKDVMDRVGQQAPDFSGELKGFPEGARRALCELFFLGESEDQTDYDLYPRCFDPRETALLMRDNIGAFGIRKNAFVDELGLWRPEETLNRWGGRATGLVTLCELKKVTGDLFASDTVTGLILLSGKGLKEGYLRVRREEDLAVVYVPEEPDGASPLSRETGNLRFCSDGENVVYVRAGACGENDEFELDEEEIKPEKADPRFPYPTEFTLREDIRELIPGMFADTSVKSVTLNGSVKTLPEGVFENCENLERIGKAEAVTSIGDRAFSGCSSLGSVSFPSATTIGDRAFSWCASLGSVSFPCVKSVGEEAFWGCESLEKLCFEALEEWRDRSFYLRGFGSDPGVSFYSYGGSRLHLEMPFLWKLFGGHAGTDVYGSPYWMEELKKLENFPLYFSDPLYVDDLMPCVRVFDCDTILRAIESFADAIRKKKEMDLLNPDETILSPYGGSPDVEETEEDVEEEPERELEISVTGSAAVVKGKGELKGKWPANLPKEGIGILCISPGITKIACVFDLPDLTELWLPESVETVGFSAFSGCNKLESVKTYKSVTESVPSSSEKKVANLSHVKSIEKSAFSGCAFEAVSAPNCSCLERYAFQSCANLKEVTVGTEVTVEGPKLFLGVASAFTDCPKLEKLILPEKIQPMFLKDVGRFTVPEAIKELRLPKGAPPIGGGSFPSVFAGSETLEKIVAPGRKKLPNEAFKGCVNLKTVEMPALVDVGDSAFKNCRNLEELTISEAVERIGTHAFKNCSALKTINLGSAKEIGDGALEGCAALESVERLHDDFKSEEEKKRIFGDRYKKILFK